MTALALSARRPFGPARFTCGLYHNKTLLSHDNKWFLFQSLLAHPVQEGYASGHVCQGRTPSFEDKEGSRRGGQRLALYFSNSNGLISVTLAVVRSYRINFKEPIKFYVCAFYESYVSMEYDMKAIKMDK